MREPRKRQSENSPAASLAIRKHIPLLVILVLAAFLQALSDHFVPTASPSR